MNADERRYEMATEPFDLAQGRPFDSAQGNQLNNEQLRTDNCESTLLGGLLGRLLIPLLGHCLSIAWRLEAMKWEIGRKVICRNGLRHKIEAGFIAKQ